MGLLLKFQFALLLSNLRVGIHCGAVQLKHKTNDDFAEDYVTNTNIPDVRIQEEDPPVQIPRIVSHTNLSHQSKEHLWPQRQSLANLPVSQSRQDEEPFIICSPHMWTCLDGFNMCMPERLRCDGTNDCLDGSDESESLCTPPCPTDMFVCADGSQCINSLRECDGVAQCKDSSDESEAFCSPPCSVDMFACADGSRCIPERWKCDPYEIHNCEDGSDQSESLCTPPCSNDMFACADGLRCIPHSRKCDRWPDCEDGSDESLSTCPFLSFCSDNEFACADGKKCVLESQVCDVISHCEDNSDESQSICSPPCSNGLHTCADESQCISKSRVCDGFASFGCNDISNNLASQCDNCTADHLFKCQMMDVDVCVNSYFKCDGDLHCTDSTDELVSECPGCVDDPSKFACKHSGQMVCLSKDHYQCTGGIGWYGNICDDGSDQDPAACNNCSLPRYGGDGTMHPVQKMPK